MIEDTVFIMFGHKYDLFDPLNMDNVRCPNKVTMDILKSVLTVWVNMTF